jgi:hypothetical protein
VVAALRQVSIPVWVFCPSRHDTDDIDQQEAKRFQSRSGFSVRRDRDATAYLAASKAHLAYAQNVQGSNNDDNRHIFLEQQADEAFEDWKRKEDLTSGSETSGEAGETVSGFSGVIGGKANSPIHRGN